MKQTANTGEVLVRYYIIYLVQLYRWCLNLIDEAVVKNVYQGYQLLFGECRNSSYRMQMLVFNFLVISRTEQRSTENS